MSLFSRTTPPAAPRRMDPGEHVFYLLDLAEEQLRHGQPRRAALHLAQATLVAVDAGNQGVTFDQLAVARRVAAVGRACGPEAVA